MQLSAGPRAFSASCSKLYTIIGGETYARVSDQRQGSRMLACCIGGWLATLHERIHRRPRFVSCGCDGQKSEWSAGASSKQAGAVHDICLHVSSQSQRHVRTHVSCLVEWLVCQAKDLPLITAQFDIPASGDKYEWDLLL